MAVFSGTTDAVVATSSTTAPPMQKIRIAKIGGRFLVFDVVEVARLRRQHGICSVLVGITPQAPNQGVFSSLPLELTPDEVTWLVRTQQCAVVADDWTEHLACLANPIQRQRHMAALARQRQATQEAADEDAANRAKHAAEVRNMMGNKKARKKWHVAKVEETSENPQEGITEVVVRSVGHLVKKGLRTVQDQQDDERFAVKTSEAQQKQNVRKRQAMVRVTPTASIGLIGGDVAETPTTMLPPLPDTSIGASSAFALRSLLARRGCFATPGLRFGGDLSVYPGDPFRYHAHFVATSYGWDEPIKLLDLVGTGRLATGVKKGLLIGGWRPADDSVVHDAEAGDAEQEETSDHGVRTFTLEWAAI